MANFFKKRNFLLVIIALLTLLAACGNEEAEGSAGAEGASGSYPDKPINIIVPFGAGGDTDRNTRTFAKYLEKELGVPAVVSNVAGSGGSTGANEVMNAKTDGYTVGAFQDSTLLNNVFGLSDFNYDDFTLAGISVLDQGNTFLVSGDSQFENWDDVVSYAKENPGEVSVATEIGAFTYIQLMALQEKEGIEFNIVDVGGGSDKNAALLGGRVDLVPNPIGLVTSYIESGDMRSIGILADERLEQFPDIPTFKEQGVDITFDKIYFWAFPPETPKDIVEKFSAAMEKVASNEEYIKETGGHVVKPMYMNPEDAMEFLDSANTKYQEIFERTSK